MPICWHLPFVNFLFNFSVVENKRVLSPEVFAFGEVDDILAYDKQDILVVLCWGDGQSPRELRFAENHIPDDRLYNDKNVLS